MLNRISGSLHDNLSRVTISLVLVLLPVAAASAACTDQQYETGSGGCYPAWYGATASGAYYTIVIPDGWTAADGLVLWNHGFQSFLTGFGSVDLESLLNPDWDGYYTGTVEPEPGLGPYADVVLGQGYAMAASSYTQTGWAVIDSHVANAELYDRFGTVAGAAPEQFYIIGGSLGGIVSLRDLEADLLPDPDGTLLLCGAVAGSVNWYEAFDLRMIYDAVCDAVSGAQLPRPWYERPDLLFGELEFLDSLNRCTGLASRLLIDEDDPLEVLAWELQNKDEAERLEEILETADVENVYFLGLSLWYAVFQLPRLLEDGSQLNGLQPFANVGIDYDDGSVNQAALRSIALPSARQLLMDNYTPVGNLGDTRILSIHTSHDGLVKVQNQKALMDLAAAERLTVAIVNDSHQPSHCGFSEEEGLAAWQSLTGWVQGGPQPAPLDLQLRCLDLAADPDSCNYDPSLEVSTGLPTFKRSNSIAVTGVNSYDAASGELSFESLQLLGDDRTYDGVLAPPAAGSSLFTISSFGETGSTPIWQHSAAFDPSQSLLYLPRVGILNLSPPDANRYDVYLRYRQENGVDGLEFVEFELAP